ncbi:LysM peptidoglycan-binding domain-containing protein [Microaerobacter geothermalis]|uniref:LysM peptidoglycan-binding domain-containing protein n=1 Tax=Microaerobacter geothermalis TaxID=674972 RepID=UPI001F27B114|nr:LysM domain-containing protein [Microaerobacter geothermalis]MCF6094710.1 LysM peptidoglycan-binding domain-containing protein [Microaerobacter geothermalis]
MSHTDDRQVEFGFHVHPFGFGPFGFFIPFLFLPFLFGESHHVKKYVVKEGDTLYKIAKRFNIPLQALITANPHIEDPDEIMPGQTINIPRMPMMPMMSMMPPIQPMPMMPQMPMMHPMPNHPHGLHSMQSYHWMTDESSEWGETSSS